MMNVDIPFLSVQGSIYVKPSTAARKSIRTSYVLEDELFSTGLK